MWNYECGIWNVEPATQSLFATVRDRLLAYKKKAYNHNKRDVVST